VLRTTSYCCLSLVMGVPTPCGIALTHLHACSAIHNADRLSLLRQAAVAPAGLSRSMWTHGGMLHRKGCPRWQTRWAGYQWCGRPVPCCDLLAQGAVRQAQECYSHGAIACGTIHMLCMGEGI